MSSLCFCNFKTLLNPHSKMNCLKLLLVHVANILHLKIKITPKKWNDFCAYFILVGALMSLPKPLGEKSLFRFLHFC